MEIQPLADRPDVVPMLAEWLYSEWNAFDGRLPNDIEAQLRENLHRDSLPITFIALMGSDVIGTVSLDESDLPPYDHLSPWLASLYVVPSCRRAGVGHALVNHVIAFAQEREVSPIYLWTAGPIRLYDKCGWRVFCCETYSGRPIRIMRWPQ